MHESSLKAIVLFIVQMACVRCEINRWIRWLPWFLNSLQKGREGNGGGRGEIMLLYIVSWRGWSGSFSQVRLKLNFKPRLKKPWDDRNLSSLSSLKKMLRVAWSPITSAKLVFHHILAVFFCNLATCIHLVFYCFLSLKIQIFLPL